MSPLDVLGIGIDIVDEREFGKTAENERALARIFSERELSDCRGRDQDRVSALARRFAGKEAVVKASGKAVGALYSVEFALVSDSSSDAPSMS